MTLGQGPRAARPHGSGAEAGGTGPPTEDDIKDTTEKAHRRFYPVINQAELCYGWFQKGKPDRERRRQRPGKTKPPPQVSAPTRSTGP